MRDRRITASLRIAHWRGWFAARNTARPAGQARPQTPLVSERVFRSLHVAARSSASS